MASSVAQRGDDLVFSQAEPLFKLLFYSRMNPGFDLIAAYAVTPDGKFVAFVAIFERGHAPARRCPDMARGAEKAMKVESAQS